jgi:small-conductance mechanosensitive channel
MLATPPVSRTQKILFLLAEAGLALVVIAIAAMVATGLILIFANEPEVMRNTAMLAVLCYAGFAALRTAFLALYAPHHPGLRMVHLGDRDATMLARWFTVVAAIGFALQGFGLWNDRLGLTDDYSDLHRIVANLVAVLLLCAMFYTQRKAVAGIILGRESARGPVDLRRFLAASWHGLASFYVVAAWLVTSIRLVLDKPHATGLLGAPFYAIALGIVVYGTGIMLVDWLAQRARRLMPPADPAEHHHATAMPPLETEERPRIRTYRELGDHAAALAAWLASLWLIVDLWSAGGGEGGFFSGTWSIVIVGLLFYIVWMAVRIAFDRKIEEEGGFSVPDPGADEGGHAASSRLATLLPLFRNALLIFMLATFVMMILSQLGVDIGPLFAGAGIVGLAVGFGAQKLIQDIFSGTFYLIDDAFRRGEYIDVGGTKGRVEKISIRSMQLRHHMGQLHTVPFGDIKEMTNYSRDWVIMKLPFRLTFDTDPELVHKLVKKLGQQLLEDPEIGPLFLQPLKSQGVYRMDESAMVIRVKFMTRPGDQFQVRKRVYTSLRQVFEANGIRFADHAVTVRVADAGEHGLDEGAIAGAAASAIRARRESAGEG